MPQQEKGLEYQERDIGLLRDLFASRVMTLAHISALHFRGRGEAAKKRVQKLKAAGLVAERPRKARDPGILFLSKAGYEFLKQRDGLGAFPRLSTATFEKRAQVSPLTLRHELEVMDVKAALMPAISRVPTMTVMEFSTWPLLHQFDVRPRGADSVRVKPDGFLRVEERAADGVVYEHAFFLEVDRSTETLDTLARRSFCYREHYSSGGYAVSLGAARAAYPEYPFRVLIVLPSDERRNNLAECLLALNPPIETLVWLTTSAALKSDPLGPVWIRPRDYRETMRGTTSGVGAASGVYRRQLTREAHVRSTVVHRALFTD